MPGSRPMYASARSAAALVGVVHRCGIGHGAVDRDDHARVRAPRDLRRIAADVDHDLAVERRRRRRSAARASGRAPPPRRRPAARRAGPRGTRTSSRRARSSPRARRPRSTCCRSSCGPPSSSCSIAGPGVLDRRARRRRRRRACRSRRGRYPSPSRRAARRPRSGCAASAACRCGSVCVASTCSTSDVPMPKASAPKAPCVEVCESPQTIVIPAA